MRITIEHDPTTGSARITDESLHGFSPAPTLAPVPIQSLDAGSYKGVASEYSLTGVDTPRVLEAGGAKIATPVSAHDASGLSVVDPGVPQRGANLDAGSA